MSKQRTITLTGRPPVRINEADWLEVARGEYDWHDGQIRSQANRTLRMLLIVRQHEDGRVIVYGVHDYTTDWQDEPSVTYRGGVLLDADAVNDYADSVGAGDADDRTWCRAATRLVVDTIRAVAADLADRSEDARWIEIGNECIADMPVETI